MQSQKEQNQLTNLKNKNYELGKMQELRIN
jgi:hypothetical protein